MKKIYIEIERETESTSLKILRNKIFEIEIESSVGDIIDIVIHSA